MKLFFVKNGQIVNRYVEYLKNDKVAVKSIVLKRELKKFIDLTLCVQPVLSTNLINLIR